MRLDADVDYVTELLPALVLFSVGLAATVAPLTATVLSDADEQHAGIASGVNNAIARAAGLLGVAALGAVIAAQFSAALRERIDPASLSPTARAVVQRADDRVLARADVSGLAPREAVVVRRATEAAAVEAFRLGMGISAALVALGGVVGLVFVRNPRRAVPCAECAGGQLAGAPLDAARDPVRVPVGVGRSGPVLAKCLVPCGDGPCRHARSQEPALAAGRACRERRRGRHPALRAPGRPARGRAAQPSGRRGVRGDAGRDRARRRLRRASAGPRRALPLSLLLDTHALLWLLAGDARIEGARAAIENERTPVLVSAVCVWEAAIKSALGKLRVPDDLPERLDAFAFERLPISDTHAWAVRALPPIHNDPFDRLLAAQALCERATIVSADPIFDEYAVARIW